MEAPGTPPHATCGEGGLLVSTVSTLQSFLQRGRSGLGSNDDADLNGSELSKGTGLVRTLCEGAPPAFPAVAYALSILQLTAAAGWYRHHRCLSRVDDRLTPPTLDSGLLLITSVLRQ